MIAAFIDTAADGERMNGACLERSPFWRFKWTKSADPNPCLRRRFYHKARQTLCGELWIHVTKIVEAILRGQRELTQTNGGSS